MTLFLAQRSLINGTATKYHALLPFHLSSSLFRRASRSLQIPASSPNRVAFEPAALLFLYQGCRRHHNRHRNLCPAIIKLLLDTEKRCPRQLCKIDFSHNRMDHFKVTAYHPTENLSDIMDSNGLFKKLWRFLSFMVSKGFKIIEVGDENKFHDGDMPKAERDTVHVILRACKSGKPEIQGNQITVEGKTYTTI